MATQASVLQSERVALKAIRELKLNETNSLRNRWLEETGGQGQFESWLAELLTKSLTVTPARESNVIDVSYKASDPNFAALMANAFVKSFIKTSIEMRVQPAKEYSEMFENQTRQLRTRLEQAQAKLSEYQKETGLLATDERIDVETARLAELSTQLVGLQAQATDSLSKQGLAAGSTDRFQEVVNSPLVTALRSDLARLEAQQKQMSARYGENHPNLAELRTNITELRARLDVEVKRIGGSVALSASVFRAREAQIKAAIEQQRAKLLKLKEQRDYAAILSRDVEGAQRALEDIQARFNRTSLESQTNQTNIQVIKEASPPSNPSSPKTLLNAALAFALGAVLALLAAFGLEFMDRRIRGQDDVALLLSVPVIGEIPECGSIMIPSAAKSRLSLPKFKPASLPRPGA